jgi:hypothetical protein
MLFPLSDLQNERDSLNFLISQIGLAQNNGLLLPLFNSNSVEEQSPAYSFYNFTFAHSYFATHKKSESVNWQKEGF